MVDQGRAPTPAIAADQLEGRWFSLVPLNPNHHVPLFELSHREQNNFRWRFRGVIPSAAAFEQSIYAGVLTQFAIVPKDRPNQFAGLVVAYNASPQDAYCYLGAVTDPKFGSGTIEGVALFLRYLFRHWPFRKVYLEVAQYNVTQYESATRLGVMKEEARLKDHIYFDNQYWDQMLFAIYRESAEEYTTRLPNLFLGSDLGSSEVDPSNDGG
jgi:RimJ/RimL family protein N-acetyltransferase